MKNNSFAKTSAILGLTAILTLSCSITAMANTTTATKTITPKATTAPKSTVSPTATPKPTATPAVYSPKIERTKAWDSLKHTLGGVPKSVKKIEYAGSIFYLGKDVTEADFVAVIALGPEALRMNPPQENGKLFDYPAYILWNSDKTVLLVHQIRYDYENILEPVAVKTDVPASLKDKPIEKPKKVLTPTEEQEYMLTAEYADAMRNEFYRLLNEHRLANGKKELKINKELQVYADIRADEQRVKFGHTRPDGTQAGSGWHDMWNVMNSRYAENALTCGTLSKDPLDSANFIFQVWKDSKGHNKHMLYDFDPEITMAFGISPKLGENGLVSSGAIFATGY